MCHVNHVADCRIWAIYLRTDGKNAIGPPRIQTGVRGGSIGLDSGKVWPVDWGSSGPAESPGARLQGPSGSSAKMAAVAARKHKLRTPAKPDPATRRGRRGVPVVAVAALWDHLFGVPRPGRTVRTRWGLLAGLAATWLVLGALVLYEHRGPSLRLDPAMVWMYVVTQAEVVVHYVRLALVPAPLVFFYDWMLQASLGAVGWQAALLAVVVMATAVGLARRHAAGFLGAWFVLILAPSSSVLPIVTEVAAEHRMYLPLAAVVAAVVLGVFLLGRRLVPSPRVAVVAGALAAVAVVGALGVETRARSRVYWSAESLWQDTVSKRPNDPRSRVAYGEALAAAGRMVEAEAQLQVAVTLAPEDPNARVRLGSVLAQQRKFDAAVPQLERALALRPADVDAHRFLGEIYAVQRQDQLAVRHYELALAFVPDDAQVMASLAVILADSRDASVVSSLEYRASAYEYAARQAFGPRR